jgi:hypothetical protein
VEGVDEANHVVRLSVMGERGAVKGGTRQFAFALGAIVT